MGALIRAFDWSSTSLGPAERWPQSLRTAVRLLLNTRHPMYIFWGRDAVCLYNDGYRPSLGLERHPQSLGSNGRAVWDEIWPVIGPQIEQVMRGDGATWHENQRLPMTRNGRIEDIYWTYSYSPIDDEAAPQGVGGVLVVCTETTRQVRAELALTAETERQHRMLQQMPGFAAILHGPTHVYSYVNDAYVDIGGHRDFLGRPVREVFPELKEQGFFELLDTVYASGEAFAAQAVPIRLADEPEPRYIDLLYEPIRDDTGAVTGIFVGGYDATVHEETKVALKQANATLEQRVAQALEEQQSLQAALVQSQKMEAVGQLTGGLAHDFNNLLMGVSGSLELMKRKQAQDRTAHIGRYIEAAQGSVKRAAALTHRLLAFSRRQTLAPKVTDVNRLVTGMHELIHRTVGPAIALECVTASPPWLALVDHGQLENALLNLAINARDAMPDGGKLTIETANLWLEGHAAAQRDVPQGEYISICVSDDGCGMAPDVAARAFDPFFTTKPIGQGTGLGLSMIYGFARQSDGQVRIQSELGRGTTVCLYLPRHQGEAEDAGAMTPMPELVRSVAKESILVVDDEAPIRAMTVEVLRELGYEVMQAESGLAGLRILESSAKVDLLVSDVGLPGGMNGRQLADAALRTRPGLKVLFITGYAEHAAVGHGHLDARMHVIVKPFELELFAHRVRELIEQSADRA